MKSTANTLVLEYQRASDEYRAETNAAKARMRADPSHDWNSIERPRLAEMHADLMAIRGKVAAREGACSCKDCIEEGAPVVSRDGGPTAWVSFGIALLPLVPREVMGTDVEVAPLAGLRLCGYCLRAYAKSKRKGAWLKRHIGV